MAFTKLVLSNPLRDCSISGDLSSEDVPMFEFSQNTPVFDDMTGKGLFTYPDHVQTVINRILIQASMLVYSRRFDLADVALPAPVVHAVCMLELSRDPSLADIGAIALLLKSSSKEREALPQHTLFPFDGSSRFPVPTENQRVLINVAKLRADSDFDEVIRAIFRAALCAQLLRHGHQWGIYLLRDLGEFLYARRLCRLKASLHSVEDTLGEALMNRPGDYLRVGLTTLTLPLAGMAVCAMEDRKILIDAMVVPLDRIFMWILLEKMEDGYADLLMERWEASPTHDLCQWYTVAYPHKLDQESEMEKEGPLAVACSIAPSHVFNKCKEHGKLTNKIITLTAINGCEDAKAMLSTMIDKTALKNMDTEAVSLEDYNRRYGTKHFTHIYESLNFDDWMELLEYYCDHNKVCNLYCMLQTKPFTGSYEDIVMGLKSSMIRKENTAVWATFFDAVIPLLKGEALKKAMGMFNSSIDHSLVSSTNRAYADTAMLDGIIA